MNRNEKTIRNEDRHEDRPMRVPAAGRSGLRSRPLRDLTPPRLKWRAAAQSPRKRAATGPERGAWATVGKT